MTTVSRRFFLGGLAMSSAGVPLLETLVNDFDLEPDRVLGLSNDDILIVRVPEWMTAADRESWMTELSENVWPHVLIVPEGVELDVLRRKKE